MRRVGWVSLVALSCASAAWAQATVSAGTVRVWGDPYMASVVEAWETGFRKYHPGVQFENKLMGTDTAMPGLYGGVADIALFGRESNQTENDGFQHSLQYKPLQLRLMTGSLEAPGKSYAPVLFVRKDNPLTRLTMAQLLMIFGCGQTGEGRPARTWGDLGLSGAWKNKPIHVYAFDIETGTGDFFLRRVQGASRKMNWAIVREFRDGRHPDGTAYDAGEQTMDALKADPYGLAVSGLHYADDDVKPLALAAAEGAPYVAATRETLIDGTYPLARMTYAFVNRPPGKAVPPLVEEFLRFVYSDEGQRLIAPDTGFLPLTARDAAKQLELLR
jgi:phosphate transport system substrate-binding protein